jgi:polar amino acid transport system permease protein
MVFNVNWAYYVPALAKAAIITIEYTFVGFVGATVVGLAVALMRISSVAPLRGIGRVYTEVFRNLPLVTEIFIIYFGLGSLGIRLDVFTAGCISLALFYGAYLAEIFRAALQGISHTQWEAGHAVGLSRPLTFVFVILPQATRLALGGTSTMLVDCLKGTSLMITVGGAELMSQAQLIVSDTFRAMEVYLVVGLIYVALAYPLSHLASKLEDRLRRGQPVSPSRIRFLQHARQAAASFQIRAKSGS